MAIFALQVFEDEGSCCSFYTVVLEGEEESETEKFFLKYEHHPKYRKALQELTVLLFEKIANESGALQAFFRFEKTAHALPPSAEIQVGELSFNYYNFPLRLYCLRLSDSLVVLFNGAEKTSRSAQEGKTSMAFHEANLYARRILAALQRNDIYIESNGRDFCAYDGSDEILIY